MICNDYPTRYPYGCRLYFPCSHAPAWECIQNNNTTEYLTEPSSPKQASGITAEDAVRLISKIGILTRELGNETHTIDQPTFW